MKKYTKEYDQITQEVLKLVLSESTIKQFTHMSKKTLHEFVTGWQHFVNFFPNYLSALMWKSPSDEIRIVIMDNFIDEMGGVENIEKLDASKTHPKLFRQFARTTGLSDRELDDLDALKPYVKKMKSELSAFVEQASFWELMGGISPGIENIFPEWITPIYKAIKGLNLFSDAELFYFDLHISIDELHGTRLRHCILDNLTLEHDLAALRTGALKLAGIQKDFLLGLHEEQCVAPNLAAQHTNGHAVSYGK